MEHVTRAFPSELRQLSALRALVREVGERGWNRSTDAAALAQLELAVDEAAANVILHAYDRIDDPPAMDLEIDSTPDRIVVCIYHQGRPFDPNAERPPTFDGSHESGFGLYLIRQTVDELAFFQDARGRQGLRLTKHRPLDAER